MAQNRVSSTPPGRQYFQKRLAAIGRSQAFEAKSPAQWKLWRRKLRRTVRQCLGLGRMEKGEPTYKQIAHTGRRRQS